LDLSFQEPYANGTVRALAIPASPSPYEAVLAGGDFTSINGDAQNYLVLLDDAGRTAEFQGSPNGSVYAVVVQSDGKILIGGCFTMVNGSPRSRLARLNADGTLDSTFAPSYPGFDSTVRSIARQSMAR